MINDYCLKIKVLTIEMIFMIFNLNSQEVSLCSEQISTIAVKVLCFVVLKSIAHKYSQQIVQVECCVILRNKSWVWVHNAIWLLFCSQTSPVLHFQLPKLIKQKSKVLHVITFHLLLTHLLMYKTYLIGGLSFIIE